MSRCPSTYIGLQPIGDIKAQGGNDRRAGGDELFAFRYFSEFHHRSAWDQQKARVLGIFLFITAADAICRGHFTLCLDKEVRGGQSMIGRDQGRSVSR